MPDAEGFKQARLGLDSRSLLARVEVHLHTLVDASCQSASKARGASSSAVKVLFVDIVAVAVPAVVAALLPVLEDRMAAAGVFVVPIDTHVGWVRPCFGGSLGSECL